MRRHVIAHRGGVIDDQYLAETGESGHLRGRRVVVAVADVDRLAGIILDVGQSLVRDLPPA
jgi:hypothetical protein